MQEDILKKISTESGLEENEIQARIEKKQKELGGLITPEGAAHIIANELGINLFEGAAKTRELKIENIIPGMEGADVAGRVMRLFPAREFDKKDGSKSRVCSIILGDETGSVRVVFWGNDTQLIEEGKIKEGDVLKIKGGYTKENNKGEAELHIGSRTKVLINPKDVQVQDRKKKIAELKEGMRSVNVLCKVLRTYEIREFEREDKTKGRVVNLLVGDETGKAKVVLWDKDVSLVENIKEGDTIKIINGYVKMQVEGPEINVGKYGKIVSESMPKRRERKKIIELKEGDKAEVRGALVELYENFTVFERKNGKGVVVNAIIDDGTACMRAAFYDRVAEILLNMPMQKFLEGEASQAISERRKELIGREIVASVSVKHSDFSGKNELIVQDLELNPDPKEEVKNLLNTIKSLKGV